MSRAAALAAAVALAGAGFGTPGPAPAQEPAATSSGPAAAALDSIEAAADSGRVEAARAALGRWMERRLGDAPPPLRARARLLQGRLAGDPDEARRAYALVAVEGGVTGARARLRLAQLHLAEGRYERALEELATVRADAPGSSLEAEAWLWTGRVREAEGEGGIACEAYRRASETAGSGGAGLREAISSALSACRRGDGTPARRSSRPGDEGAGEGRRFVVQLGAFSMRESAQDLHRRLEEAGFDARVTERDPGDALIRVRAGGFEREAGAEELASRLENAGFDAIVVEIGPSGDES